MPARSSTRRTAPSPGRMVLLGVAALGVLAVILGGALRAPNGVPFAAHKQFFVTVDEVGNLREHNDVRIAGVRVGQVLKIEPSAGKARLELQLDNGLGALPADTVAVVRSAGLLGQRYLQIVPGRSARSLHAGGAIRPASTSMTLGIPEALQIFDRQTRGGLGDMLNGLGAGVLGQGDNLNEAIGISPQAATDFRGIVDAVLARPPAARALLGSLDDGAGAFDASSGDIAATLIPANVALSPMVDRRPAVQATLAAAPPALAAARPALDESRTLLANARHLAAASSRTLITAPAALRATTALLKDSRTPLAAARPLLARVQSAVPATLRITRALQPVLGPLKTPLDDLVAPIGTIAAHRCDLTNFAQVWRSFLSMGTTGGTRIGALGEIRAEALLMQPFAGAGEALNLPGELVDRNVRPAPCQYGPSTYSLVDPTK